MGPHPSGLPHPGLALGGGSGLLALSGALGAQLAAKDERAHLEAVAAAAAAAADHHRGSAASPQPFKGVNVAFTPEPDMNVQRFFRALIFSFIVLEPHIMN